MIEKPQREELINQLDPNLLAKYLQQNGWKLLKTKKDYIKVLQYFIKGRLDKQVNIPLDRELGDYITSLRNALNTVATVEKRSYEDLLNSLMYYTSDTIKIRLNRPSVVAGSIVMDDAINMFSNVKKLIEAAAMDLSCPKVLHRGRMTSTVQNFIDNCRFGQTEIGSYIITVICPLSKDDAANGVRANILSDEELYDASMARQVTDRIMRTINTLKNDLDTLIEIDNSTRMIGYHMSSNFVDALSGLNLDHEDAELEFMVNWAPVAKKKTDYDNKVRISHAYYDRLIDLSNRIKAKHTEDFDICGKVIRLESELEEDNYYYGKVTIAYVGEGRTKRKQTMWVDKANYDLAVKAHFNGSLVHVVGEKHEDNSIDIARFEIEKSDM